MAFVEKLREKRVVVYGLGKTINDCIDYIRMRFRVIGGSDSDFKKAVNAEKLGILFITRKQLSEAAYDYILITSIYDNEIYRQLTEQGIPEEKILQRSQWCRMRFWNNFGELNPEKTFYILSRPIHVRDGLYSFLFAFLEQLDFVERNGYIPVVDMQNFQNQYLEKCKVGKENAWEYYFESLSEYSLEEVYRSKNVILGYDDSCYKGGYEKKYDIKRMSELYRNYIRYNSKTLSYVWEEYEKIMDKSKKTLGVLYRGSDMNALKLRHHPIQPTVDEMTRFIYKYMREWQCERIFLSTEDAQAAEKLKAEFGEILSCTNQKRFDDTREAWLANISFDRPHDRYLRGMEYLITIELLSRCDCLLAGICAGSVCAQIMNCGTYEHIEMVDRGVYE